MQKINHTKWFSSHTTWWVTKVIIQSLIFLKYYSSGSVWMVFANYTYSFDSILQRLQIRIDSCLLKADLLCIARSIFLWHMKVLWISWLPDSVQRIKISLLISESSIGTEIIRIYILWLIESKGHADTFNCWPNSVCNCWHSKSANSFDVGFEV